MKDTTSSSAQRVATRIEDRRVRGILRNTPGALGEPPRLLDLIDRNTTYVSRTETTAMIEREVARHIGSIHKADLTAMQRKVDKWVEHQTLLPKNQSGD